MYCGNGFVIWRKIYLLFYWLGLVGIYFFVFVLVLGELLVILLVVLLGEGVVSICIFNLLYYGGVLGVVSLCFVMMLVFMSVIVVLFVVFRVNCLWYFKVLWL